MKMPHLLKAISLIFISLLIFTSLSACESAHKHVYDQKVANENFIATYATCTAKAKYYYSCKCGEKQNVTFEYGSPLGHDYDDWVSNGNGTHSKVCKNNCLSVITENCDQLLVLDNNEKACSKCYVDNKNPSENPDQTPEHVHDFSIKEIKQEYLCSPAKCTAKALYFYSCQCGEKGNNTFEYGYMLEHEEVWETKEPATCGKAGLMISKCTLCKEQVNQKPIIALEHNFINEKCSVCGDLMGTEGLRYQMNSTKDAYELVGLGSAISLDIIVPKLYNGLPVKAISQNAFKNSKIKSIILSENLVSINNGAFSACSELESIKFPDSLLSIGDSAFINCKKLISVTIGKNVKYIGASAFYNCVQLKNVTLNDNIEYVGKYAFDNSQKVNYNIKNKIKYLGNEQNKYLCAISVEDKYITNLTIDTSCKVVASMAFQNCKQVTAVFVPKSVKTICDLAFSYCNGLTSVEFEQPNNWCIKSEFDSVGSSIVLSNKTKNADYLNNSYLSYIFYKNK